MDVARWFESSLSVGIVFVISVNEINLPRFGRDVQIMQAANFTRKRLHGTGLSQLRFKLH